MSNVRQLNAEPDHTQRSQKCFKWFTMVLTSGHFCRSHSRSRTPLSPVSEILVTADFYSLLGSCACEGNCNLS